MPPIKYQRQAEPLDPLITVIIPTFERPESTFEAAESVLGQSYAELECLVIDDGSSKETIEQMSNWVMATADSRLKLLKRAHGGVSAARNFGITAAKGNLIALLDSDDCWKPNKLKKQMALHRERPELLISQTNEVWIRNNKRVNPKQKHKKTRGDLFEPSLELCAISPSSVLMRKSLLDAVGLFDERLPACEDYELWLRITAQWEVGLVDEDLIIKRGGHPDQLSTHYPAMDRFRLYGLLKLWQQAHLKPDQQRATKAQILKKAHVLALGGGKHGTDLGDLPALIEAILKKPGRAGQGFDAAREILLDAKRFKIL